MARRAGGGGGGGRSDFTTLLGGVPRDKLVLSDKGQKLKSYHSLCTDTFKIRKIKHTFTPTVFFFFFLLNLKANDL